MTKDQGQRTNLEPEWMDEPGADPEMLRDSLAFIRLVNRWLGYTRATLGHLKRFSEEWTPGKAIRILDVATGSADVPLAILQWAARRGFDVRVVGIDRSPACAESAAAHPNLSIVRADALNLPFGDGSFDYVITSMFLHHLDDAQIVTALREMDRVTTRGLIVADLLRSRRAYAWISLFTLAANPMVRHDARVSVAQALSRDEVLSMRTRAGIEYTRYHRHFGHRFVLAGEKTRISKPPRDALPAETR